jgi:hypothetical protein
MRSISRRRFLVGVPLAGAACWLGQGGSKGHPTVFTTGGGTLFEDVRMCRGRKWTLSAPCAVHVDGAGAISGGVGLIVEPGTAIVDGCGRTLMPSLLEAQALAMSRPSARRLLVAISEWAYIEPTPAPGAGTLGVIIMPRIWPVGAFVRLGGRPGERAHGGFAKAHRPRSLVLPVGDCLFNICDPAGAILLSERQLHRDLASHARWGSGVVVHALTPDAIRAEIARATRVDRTA